MRSATDFGRMRERGRALRGAHCLVVVDPCPGEPTKVAFVASRRGVGGAVDRNRARRRLREIVRRRWPQMRRAGVHLMFVAFRSALAAPHPELSRDVERLLVQSGVLAPPETP
jgi:ribonuclease P protein component